MFFSMNRNTHNAGARAQFLAWRLERSEKACSADPIFEQPSEHLVSKMHLYREGKDAMFATVTRLEFKMGHNNSCLILGGRFLTQAGAWFIKIMSDTSRRERSSKRQGLKKYRDSDEI